MIRKPGIACSFAGRFGLVVLAMAVPAAAHASVPSGTPGSFSQTATPNLAALDGTTTTTTTTTSTSSTTTSSSSSSTSSTVPLPLCGDANDDGKLTAPDALFVLRAAVGLETPCTLSTCDTDRSGAIQASDALRILRAAVGQPVVLDCRS